MTVYNIGATPIQLQNSYGLGFTLSNSGTKNAYLGNDSSVNESTGYAIQPGVSVPVGQGAIIWAVCATGEATQLATIAGAAASTSTIVEVTGPVDVGTVTLAPGSEVAISGPVSLASGTTVDAVVTGTVDATINGPVSLAAGTAVDATINGPVSLASGTTVTADISGPVTLAAGTSVDATVTGNVALVQGTVVGLATGSTVDISGPVTLAAGTNIDATVTGNVSLVTGTEVNLAAGATVALASGTTVDATVTGDVTVVKGSEVALSSGSTVAISGPVSLASGTTIDAVISGPVSLASGTTVDATVTGNVALVTGTEVNLAAGATVALASGTTVDATVTGNVVVESGAVNIQNTPNVHPIQQVFNLQSATLTAIPSSLSWQSNVLPTSSQSTVIVTIIVNSGWAQPSKSTDVQVYADWGGIFDQCIIGPVCALTWILPVKGPTMQLNIDWPVDSGLSPSGSIDISIIGLTAALPYQYSHDTSMQPATVGLNLQPVGFSVNISAQTAEQFFYPSHIAGMANLAQFISNSGTGVPVFEIIGTYSAMAAVLNESPTQSTQQIFLPAEPLEVVARTMSTGIVECTALFNTPMLTGGWH